MVILFFSKIGDCTALNILSVRENIIKVLPEELGKLSNLHVLDLSGNKLENLPMTIASLNLNGNANVDCDISFFLI